MSINSNVMAMKNHPKTIDYPLKDCPFCGSPGQLRPTNLFADTGYRARCSTCGVNTPVVIVGTYIMWKGEHGKTFDDDEAAAEAARIWNERAEVAL